MRLLLFVCLFLSSAAFGQKTMRINAINDSVYIVTTWGQYKSEKIPANCMYVLTSEGAVLIDSPWDTTQILPLIDSIKEKHNLSVVLCIATHHHDDRTGGFSMLRELNIPTWSSALTKEYCIKKGENIAQNTFVGDTTFIVGDLEFETYYPGHGHAPDNIVIWFQRYDLLYGGCFVKSMQTKSLGNVADADLKLWAEGMKKVMKRYKRPSYIIPGHEDWMSEKSLQHTLKLLEPKK
jgi:metallo-beta-lactamase class B